jgi:hypothetical protein
MSIPAAADVAWELVANPWLAHPFRQRSGPATRDSNRPLSGVWDFRGVKSSPSCDGNDLDHRRNFKSELRKNVPALRHSEERGTLFRIAAFTWKLS